MRCTDFDAFIRLHVINVRRFRSIHCVQYGDIHHVTVHERLNEITVLDSTSAFEFDYFVFTKRETF